ncbi:MAG TPA: hypothetical protein VIA18_23145 [Polyangia bacterium]|jgi:hypothetical protein|nr:hypothetical protein [Polyangia bacterium]HWE28061.1 hypothetical protein [Polyangia bacterium]
MKTKKIASKGMTKAEKARKLDEARTLGQKELGWVHGGGNSAAACCSWKPRVTLSS